MTYRKTKRKCPGSKPSYSVRMAGSRTHVDLRKLPWWQDPVVKRILRELRT